MTDDDRMARVDAALARQLSAAMRDAVLKGLALRRIIDLCLDQNQSEGVLLGRVMEVAMKALDIKVDHETPPN